MCLNHPSFPSSPICQPFLPLTFSYILSIPVTSTVLHKFYPSTVPPIQVHIEQSVTLHNPGLAPPYIPYPNTSTSCTTNIKAQPHLTAFSLFHTSATRPVMPFIWPLQIHKSPKDMITFCQKLTMKILSTPSSLPKPTLLSNLNECEIHIKLPEALVWSFSII